MFNRSSAAFCEDNFVANIYFGFNQSAVVAVFASAYSQNLALLRFFFYCGIRQENAAGSFFFYFYNLYNYVIS